MSIDWKVETSVSPADHVVWLRTYTYAITISVLVNVCHCSTSVLTKQYAKNVLRTLTYIS